MTLRRASPADAAFVHALWTRADSALHLVPPEADEIAERSASGTLLIYTDATGPLGFATVNQWVPRVWSIMATAVRDPGRGQGRAMLTAVLDDLFHARGAHRVGLDTTLDNAPALALYARMGFVHEGVWRECWQRPNGDWVDCALMAILARDWPDRR